MSKGTHEDTDNEKSLPVLPNFKHEKVLAPMLGLVPKSMWKKRKDGTGPVPTIIGRHVFYADKDVDEWLERCRQVKPAKPAPRARRGAKNTRRRSLGRTREGRAA